MPWLQDGSNYTLLWTHHGIAHFGKGNRETEFQDGASTDPLTSEVRRRASARAKMATPATYLLTPQDHYESDSKTRTTTY